MSAKRKPSRATLPSGQPRPQHSAIEQLEARYHLTSEFLLTGGGYVQWSEGIPWRVTASETAPTTLGEHSEAIAWQSALPPQETQNNAYGGILSVAGQMISRLTGQVSGSTATAEVNVAAAATYTIHGGRYGFWSHIAGFARADGTMLVWMRNRPDRIDRVRLSVAVHINETGNQGQSSSYSSWRVRLGRNLDESGPIDPAGLTLSADVADNTAINSTATINGVPYVLVASIAMGDNRGFLQNFGTLSGNLGFSEILGAGGGTISLSAVSLTAPTLAPVAQIDGPREVVVGHPATFTSDSYDPDDGTGPNQGITAWQWTDGEEPDPDGSSPTVTYTWLTPGTKLVRLLVVDNEGISGSVVEPIRVVAPDRRADGISYQSTERVERDDRDFEPNGPLPVNLKFRLDATIRNASAAVVPPVSVSFVLTVDSIIGNADDTHLVQVDGVVIPPNGSRTVSVEDVNLPVSVPYADPYEPLRPYAGGRGKIGVLVDSTYAVDESDEDNNSAIRRVTMWDPNSHKGAEWISGPFEEVMERLKREGFAPVRPPWPFQDGGYARPLGETYSYYTGRMMPPGTFRDQAIPVRDKTTGQFRGVSMQRSEPSPPWVWDGFAPPPLRDPIGWTWYVYEHHAAF